MDIKEKYLNLKYIVFIFFLMITVSLNGQSVKKIDIDDLIVYSNSKYGVTTAFSVGGEIAEGLISKGKKYKGTVNNKAVALTEYLYAFPGNNKIGLYIEDKTYTNVIGLKFTDKTVYFKLVKPCKVSVKGMRFSTNYNELILVIEVNGLHSIVGVHESKKSGGYDLVEYDNF